VDGALEVRFLDRVMSRPSGDTLVFGRGAELDIDDNPRLHRRLGYLEHADGWWWLANVGRTVPLQLLFVGHSSTVVLQPGTRCALTSQTTEVSFRVGRSRYQLTLVQPDLDESLVPPQSDTLATATVTHDVLPLNKEQRQLLAALCESRLRDPFAPLVIPKNSEIADRLGWSRAKYNRKLDYLCERCTRHGAPGLQRTEGRALERRRVLAEWVLSQRLVTAEDLQLLP